MVSIKTEFGGVAVLSFQRSLMFFLGIPVLAVFLPALSVWADDSAEANRLMVEAIQLVDAADKEPSAEAKINLLRRAQENVTAIVERFPSTDLAVKLAAGQRIGRVSLKSVRGALDEALLARPREPGAPVRAWRHRSRVAAAAFLRGGRRAVTAGQDGAANVRDVGTGEVVRAWEHGSPVTATAVSRDRRRILTAGDDRAAVLRNIRTGNVLDAWEIRGAPSALALHGRRGLAGLWSAVHLFEVNDRKVLRTWRHRAPVTAVAFSPDGSRTFMGLADGRASLADVRTGAKLHRWKHPGSAGGGVMSVAFSPDGRRIVSGSASGVAALRDAQTGKTLREWDLGYSIRVTAVAWSPNKPWVLTGDEGGEVGLRHARTGKTLRKWRYGAPPTAIAFSPDSRRALMGFGDGAAIVCDIVLPGRGQRGRTALTRDGGCW